MLAVRVLSALFDDLVCVDCEGVRESEIRASATLLTVARERHSDWWLRCL
jgi:hypothetical protein